jgi:glycerol-3-phosphate acyltransferase PlsY
MATLMAYVVGSLPFGLLVARIVSGVDIRTLGSGNIGATNVARSIGATWGACVLLLDALKGMLSVLVLPRLFLSETANAFGHVEVCCGIAAIVGHMFPVWLRFQGGKGVATALGVIFVLSWQATLAATGMFAMSMLVSRIVSISSILATLAFAACELWLLGSQNMLDEKWSLALFSVLAPLLIIIRHRMNVVRLWQGEEPRFQFKKSKADDSGKRPPENGNAEN